jgi:phosphohistidine phosphatase SixA
VKLCACIALGIGWLVGVAVTAQAMPAQVMIIRHAEKFDDRHQIHLSPRGRTRAKALAQFFQSDPRVLEYGLPAAIIAQCPSPNKKSVRCEETVEPLSKALGQPIINCFAYGQVTELAQWLKASNEWDSKSVVVCAQHMDVVNIAKALGVPQVRQRVWPHETYDRVWLIDFSPSDGSVTSFRDIPQRLLFGDSFQVASVYQEPGTVRFSQTYRETLNGAGPASAWKCNVVAEARGDFSQFDDQTLPVLRVGGFTFGYHATTLGRLKENKDAEVTIDPAGKSGSLRYNYKTSVNGNEKTYAWVTFSWDKEGLKAELQADVDESAIVPDLNMPVECHLGKADGTVIGVIDCYLAFGEKRFFSPVGTTYHGTATTTHDESNKGVYQVNIKDANGLIVKKF